MAKKLLCKSLITATAAALGLMTNAAQAAPSAFDGLYGQAILGVATGETQLRQFNPDTTISDQSFAGLLSVGYSKNLGPLNLAASIFATPRSISMGGIAGTDFSGPWQDDFRVRRLWGISVEPGLYLAPKTLAYGKVGLVWAKGSNFYDYDGSKNKGVESRSHHGVSLGLGLRHAMTSKVDLVFEIQQSKLSRERYWKDVPETYRPSLLTTGVGVAFRF